MKDVEPELTSSLDGLLNADISKLEQSFMNHMNEYETNVLEELRREGSTITSDEESKVGCIIRMCTIKMLNETGAQINKFRQGLHEILPADMTRLFSANELLTLISGAAESMSDEVKAQLGS